MVEQDKGRTRWAENKAFAKEYFISIEIICFAMPPERAFSLWSTAKSFEHVPGSVVELGVYRGGSAYLLSKALPKKQLHLFDTFKGLPNPSPIDLHRKGEFSGTSVEQVKRLLPSSKSIFHVGDFPQTFEKFSSPIALAHLDADLYESTKNGLETFWPFVSAGGGIIGDDYGWRHCPGVKKAFDEFCERNKLSIEFPAQYQCVIRKK